MLGILPAKGGLQAALEFRPMPRGAAFSVKVLRIEEAHGIPSLACVRLKSTPMVNPAWSA
jgi:hypothetical protein